MTGTETRPRKPAAPFPLLAAQRKLLEEATTFERELAAIRQLCPKLSGDRLDGLIEQALRIAEKQGHRPIRALVDLRWRIAKGDEDLEKDDGGEPRMPFGRYEGQKLSKVPEGYLWWALEEAADVDRHEGLAELIEEELEERGDR